MPNSVSVPLMLNSPRLSCSTTAYAVAFTRRISRAAAARLRAVSISTPLLCCAISLGNIESSKASSRSFVMLPSPLPMAISSFVSKDMASWQKSPSSALRSRYSLRGVSFSPTDAKCLNGQPLNFSIDVMPPLSRAP